MPPSPKRGAVPSPRSSLAAAVPHTPVAGVPLNFLLKPKTISMWGNDVHGDCVTAEEAFAKACNNPEIFISDAEVISWATAHDVLEGANLAAVLTTMQTDGFVDGPYVYDDGPHYSVDWTNGGILQSAIANGPVKIGIAADQVEAAWNSTDGQSGWFATDLKSDSNEDHCVSLCGYGSISWLAQQFGVPVPTGVDGTKPGYAMFTWNSIGIIDVPSMLAVTHEAWVRQPHTVVKPAAKAPPTLVGKFSSGVDEILGYDPGGESWQLVRLQGSLQALDAGSTANFGQLSDGRPIWVGDFTRVGHAEVLFYYPGDGNWWVGHWDGSKLAWQLAGNTLGKISGEPNFGQMTDGRLIWTGDFNDTAHTNVAFYSSSDQNWWRAEWNGSSLAWTLSGTQVLP